MSSLGNNTTSYTYFRVSSPLLAATWITFSIFALFYVASNIRTQRPYPVLGDCTYWGRRLWFFSRWFQDSRNILQEGHKMYSEQNKKWSTWVFDDLFHVLPPRMLNELKTYRPEKLNFSRIVEDQFNWHFYMGNTLTDREYVAVVQKYLVSNLPRLTEVLADTIKTVLARRLEESNNSRGWKTISLWDGFLDICHDVVGETLLGDLGASQEYLDNAKGFTETVSLWSGGMHILPNCLRYIYYRLSPGGRQIQCHLSKCKSLVVPELQRLEKEKPRSLRTSVARGFIQHARESGRLTDYDEMVHQMLILTFAAAPMWNMILNQVIQNHAAYPDYHLELRTEVQAALAKHGGWTEAAFLDMPRVESFIRETLRCTPPIMYTAQRKVMQPLQLSDGTLLKPGDKVMIATKAILHDPDIYSHPEEFNPKRFYDAELNVAKFLTVTQTPEFPVFGYGNQTCPGRYFASLATKIAFAQILTNYDVKFFPRRVGKPVDWPISATLMPNMDTFMAFRRKH